MLENKVLPNSTRGQFGQLLMVLLLVILEAPPTRSRLLLVFDRAQLWKPSVLVLSNLSSIFRSDINSDSRQSLDRAGLGKSFTGEQRRACQTCPALYKLNQHHTTNRNISTGNRLNGQYRLFRLPPL
ncbi:hypothetical protein BASA81_007594 [Batrachochytrium salamandrivorans]|nr:hypothetical protein BASA81_007594 [Batrachochytrium salamandrivorans]